jgi:Helix-turn-helix domain
MVEAWELDLSATHKLVLLALADNANEDGICWPSIATVARKSGLSVRCVQTAIRQMSKAGIVSVREKAGQSNSYKLTPEHGSRLPPRDVQRGAPGAPPPPHQVHPTPAPGAPHPRTRCTQNPNESSENPKKACQPVDKREEGKRLLPRVIAAISAPDLRKSLPPDVHTAVRRIGDWYALGMKPRDLRGQTEQQFLNAYADGP